MTKVLIVGSLIDSSQTLYSEFISKLEKINEKYGPFDLIISLGDPGNHLCTYDGKLCIYSCQSRLAVQSQSQSSSQQSSLVNENIIQFVGNGVFQSAEGVQLAYQFMDCGDQMESQFSNRPGVNFDILLTQQWPSEINKKSRKMVDFVNSDDKACNDALRVMQQCRPKYVFSDGQNVFYEREPFYYDENDQLTNTRFIGLGKYGNNEKQRWFYAFTVSKQSGAQIPADITPSPYSSQRAKRTLTQASGSANNTDNKTATATATNTSTNSSDQRKKPRPGYICKICKSTEHFIQDCPQKSQRLGAPSTKVIDVQKCWFCLSNPDIESHLIVSIGKYYYVALPKGPLCKNHVLIIPIAHQSSLLSPLSSSNTENGDSDGDDSKAQKLELQKYMLSITQMYNSLKQTSVFLEINYRTQHSFVQCIPIAEEQMDEDRLVQLYNDQLHALYGQDASMVESTANSQSPSPLCDSYIALRLASTGKLYIYRFQHRFEINIGRAVMAKFIGAEKKSDWRDCVYKKHLEVQLAEDFKTQFQEYDFTL
ncbi:hypothetical protein MIR68_001608 [Amoeboaphelidium protococcarum]|nr:hypothetical protein MIR68_001608 [Amoeboaphelidium protococcarum]